MEIVYYRDVTGHIPVKEYLSKYDLSNPLDKKRFATIEAVIMMAADKGGIAGGEFSLPLNAYNFHEFRLKEGKKLVRILYFAFQEEKLVLLNAFDKPEKYEKGRKREVDSKIQAALDKAEECYNDFLKNPNHHEKYE